jgi:RHH-type proline utilization regulon transcriptional repressor/proline dehydrogenase/delta 1-pyrroline-5-carboxylate dehydrogenase
VPLVKGAYWDAEIKRAQELGLPHYPVFTHKHHTDVSYLACARALLDASDVIYPQFATHNAATIAAILQMAARAARRFELQRLHGMGEGVYREVLKNPLIACRVYAPVGRTRTCWPIWCAACWRTAPTRPSCTSWPMSRWAWTSC